MAFFDQIFRRKDTVIKSTKPYLGVEFGIDETAIYKRLKLVPYMPDALLTKKGIKIYESMMKDAEIEECINTLKTIRLSTGWQIKAASDNAKDKEIADFVEFNLKNVEGSFDDDLREIMSAIEYGISINELVWDVEEKGRWKGKIVLRSIKSKNPKYFNIYTDDFDNIRENGIVNISAFGYGEQYPTEKFVIYSFNKQFENIWGTSRLRALYDLWFLKQVFVKAWGVYLEKFGHPFPVLKHPPNLDDDTKNYLLNMLRQLRLETGIMLPEGLELTLTQANTAGANIHQTAIDFINKQIRKTILGQTLTSETGGTGSYALGKVHYDILLFYEEQIGRDVEAKAINNQIIRRIVDYNFSDFEDYPTFEFKPLVQDDIIQILDKYIQAVNAKIITHQASDEKLIREWLKLPPLTEKLEEQKKEQTQEEQTSEDVQLIETFAEKIFTGVNRRTFTRYEDGIVDFAEMKAEHENIKDKYVIQASKIVQDGILDIISQIQKKKIIETKNFDEINRIVFPATGDLKEVFKQFLVEAFEKAYNQARSEIARKKKKVKKMSEYLRFQYDIDLRRINYDEALKYFDAKSFDMAGVEKENILKQVKQRLFSAIKTGATLKETVKAIQDDLQEYYTIGEVEDEAMKGYRIETIIRTNVTDAMNEGRKMFFESPELEGYVVAYQYSAILDDRVRPNHAAMDGRIYAVNNPIWDIWTPSNGYNCRCVLIPITQDEEWEESPPPPVNVKPDAGFEKPGHRG
jgi:SPP1 gp7 family putative phage head morphogenesis protein